MNSKVTDLQHALDLIQDGDTITTSGFGGGGFPEELVVALGRKYASSGKPEGITALFAAGQGDFEGRGLECLAHPGLLRRIIGAHYNTCPNLVKLILGNAIEAYNLPQGVISHLYRAIAAHTPGVITKVGLNTFVDPRLEGGKVNDKTTEDLVQLIELNGEEWLLYPSMPIDVALLRGTTGDELGNISMEEEAIFCGGLAMAQAAKNTGGKVIVQVKNLVRRETIDAQQVKIPGNLVDAVVLCSDPATYHQQTFLTSYSPVLAGHLKTSATHLARKPLTERKVIARRAAMELFPGAIVNFGIGIPDNIPSVLDEEGVIDELILTVESGPTGGVPRATEDFGVAVNPWAIIEQESQFDYYDGGGLDLAYLGLAQADRSGNVNVSRFARKLAGCGGFINISQNTRKVVFCGTFTAGGLEARVEDGKIRIVREGTFKTFIDAVAQLTFSSDYANKTRQEILYITERAVFKLTRNGLALIEIAPGVDLEKDVLSQMEFTPIISDDPRTMDSILFSDDSLGLRRRFEEAVAG